jgi:signal transduction histidine kinase
LRIEVTKHRDQALLPRGLSPGEYVILSIGDTGCGMDDETLARAFDPFFTTKAIGTGSGLGLPMVQGFAAQSGGAVQIRSKLGEGTTVELWLPQAREVPADPAAVDRPTSTPPQTGAHPSG